jgi:EAL domain-containing protein (putative c-di-GMP-specific phosphodiesterase class I)
MGVSTYSDNISGFDELVEKAFLAIEKVKEMKLNFWIYEGQAMDIKYNNIELLGDINQSLQKDYFELYYQPKIDLRNNQVTSYEALIRWNHPEKGFISPGEFIPKVEKSSLIEPLTDWVIEKSISDIKEYEYKENELDINVAINISARNFQDPNFVDNLFKHIDSYNLDPTKFAIEITETDLMIEMESNIDKLYRLRSRGVQIYLDDFGKGYSSLKYLKKLPIDYIKIDKFFIEDVEKEATKQDIVLSIIKLSHALDIEVVAEGVEKESQLEYLRSIDCDYAQGYYFTRPDKKENIINWAKTFNEIGKIKK